MPRMILPVEDLKSMIRERRSRGLGRRDEVWNGVYVMSPEADNEHQELATDLAGAVKQAVAIPGRVRSIAGTNVSDRAEGWRKNFRIPDVAVFLPGNRAEDRRSHWLGGPDFAVEILGRGDRSRKKFDFYARVNVRELMLIARAPWQMEIHRHDGTSWSQVGSSSPSSPSLLSSLVLDLGLRLIDGEERPRVEVTRPGHVGCWLA